MAVMMSGDPVLVRVRLSRKPKPGVDIEFPIDAQDKTCTDWAVNDEGWRVAGVAADYISGRTPPWDCPDLRSWVTNGEKMSQYKGIAVPEFARLTRGEAGEVSRIEAWAVENDKKLIVRGPNGGVQFPPREGPMNSSDFWQWTNMKRQASDEWERIRERSMRKQEDIIRAGYHVGRIPFGCHLVGETYHKDLYPTAIGIKYAPLIFERIANGWSLMRVCRWLDSEGVPTMTQIGQGRRYAAGWSPKSVAEIIRNRMYYNNERRSRKTGRLLNMLITDKPLVDASLWLRANQALSSAKVGRRGPATLPTALLTGVLFCGNCGSPMYRNAPKQNRSNPWWTYYRCNGQLPQRKGCGTMVAIPFLDDYVNDQMGRNHQPVLHRKLITGDDHSAEYDTIVLKLRDLPTLGLSDEDEDTERQRLRQIRDDLKAEMEEGTPSRWIDVAYTRDGQEVTDPAEWFLRDDLVTYASEWESADPAHKRELLSTRRITFQWLGEGNDKQPMIVIGQADEMTA